MFYSTLLYIGIIYLVDSNDRERLSEAKDELHKMLQEDELRDASLLVLANKQVRCLNKKKIKNRRQNTSML